MKRYKKIIAGVAALVLSGYFLYKQNNDLEISTYEFCDNKIPEAFDGFKILQISDLHSKSFGKDNRDLISAVNSQDPDIIVVTGDIYYSYKDRIEESIRVLRKLARDYPVYFVSGNHEQRDHNFKIHMSWLKTYGIKIIDNDFEEIETCTDNQDVQFEKSENVKEFENAKKDKNAQNYSDTEMIKDSEKRDNKKTEKIAICGLKDPSFYRKPLRYVIFEQKAKSLRKKIPKDMFTILLSHRQHLIDIYADAGYDLIFSGHAHGGQMRFFGIGLIAPNEGFFPYYTGGVYKQKKATLVVSRGLGRTVFFTRLFNKPEIVVVSLRNI